MRKLLGLNSDRRGNAAAPGAMFFVVLVILIGGSLDLMSVSNQKSSLQTLVDNAALAAVNELSITSQDIDRVKAVASAYTEKSDLNILSVNTRVNTDLREVTVSIDAEPMTNFPKALVNMKDISVSATARLSGQGGNICMIGLSPSSMSTLRLRSRAAISADNCAIYSNSDSKSSIWVASTANVTADLICVAGGYHGPANDAQHVTLEDCTPISDPLSKRPVPSVGECDYNNTVVSKNQELSPGVYCGGIVVDGGTAKLASGDYVLTGGPLVVQNNGTIEGEYVGFYLSGAQATLQFDYDSNVSLSAPKNGMLTGLLFFSSPHEAIVETKKSARIDRTIDRKTRRTDGVKKPDHFIKSDNARRLVGTIYLPNGKLLIDGRSPIADRSEYTVIIADTFELQDGPNLVLRTDYHLSDIPVPEGVGPMTDVQSRLVN